MSEDLKLIVENQTYEGWERVSVNRSMLNLAGTFSISVSDQLSPELAEWVFVPGSEAVIQIDNHKIFTGYIDEVNAEETENNRGLELTGREKTADLVDCSASEKKIKYKSTDIYTLASQIVTPFGIQIVAMADVYSKKFKLVMQPGETPFEILNKKCQELGCLLNTDSEGRLVVTNASSAKAKSKLIYGQNIKGMRYSQNDTNRFSKYIVRGQTVTTGTGWARTKKVTAVNGIAEDPDIRYRPTVIQARSNTNQADAKRKATWEKNTRRGRSRVLDVITQGFYQTGIPELWDINKNVYVEIPRYFLAESLLIVELSYEKDENGTTTSMKLMPREAFVDVAAA